MKSHIRGFPPVPQYSVNILVRVLNSLKYASLVIKIQLNLQKRPPKMQRLCGRLWEVVVTRIQPQGVSSEKSARHIYFMEDNLLHAISK